MDDSTLAAPGTPDYDKLGKVRPILTKLSEQFGAVYEPRRDISIDEAMVPYKGRSSIHAKKASETGDQGLDESRGTERVRFSI